MDQKWRIIYYETRQGNSPIRDFIQSLDAKTQNKIADILDLLEEFGILVGHPHSKKVTGTPLWELRILGSGNNIRIFYVAVVNRKFLLLHAFPKKKQKTDIKEIKIAIDRLNDFKSLSKN